MLRIFILTGFACLLCSPVLATDWYAINADRVNPKCIIPRESPVEMIKRLQICCGVACEGEYEIKDIKREGEIVQVEITVHENDLAGDIYTYIYYREKKDCENQLAKNKKAKEEELEKYR